MQTPRFCGFCSIAGTFDLAFCGVRPLRTSWLIVGIVTLHRCGGDNPDRSCVEDFRPVRHPSESWGLSRQAATPAARDSSFRWNDERTETLHPKRPFGHRVTLTAAPHSPSRRIKGANRKGLGMTRKACRTNRQCSALLFERDS